MNVRGRAAVATRVSPIPGPLGHVLLPLRESAGFTDYRGRKHDDPSPVLAITFCTEQPSTQSIRRLEHECSFSAALDPAAAKPLGITRRVWRAIEIGQFLRLSVALSGAAGQLDGLELIHKAGGHERGTGTRGHTKVRLHFNVGWHTTTVGAQQPSFCRLGDLPSKGVYC